MKKYIAEKSEILVNDFVFHAYHGVYASEAEVGTAFRVDLHLRLDNDLPCFRDDEILSALNYETVVERLHDVCVERRFKLLEALAQSIAETMLEFEQVNRVDVSVFKDVSSLMPKAKWLGVRRVLSKAD